MFKDLIVELYLTEDCNMRCRYCYVNKGKRKMNWEIAKQSIDFISSLQYDSVIVCFFGGEPLIEWGLLKKTVEYAKSKKIDRFNVCTNAILLNKGILTYFKKIILFLC